MTAIERLRAMLNEGDWRLVSDEDAAQWLHANGAAVEALYQAAKENGGDGYWLQANRAALAAAVRRVEAAQ